MAEIKDSENILSNLFHEIFEKKPNTITKLKGDGSDRQIYRLTSGPVSVVGIWGQNRDENKAFIAFSRHFHKAGLPVPEIMATDSSGYAYLETDLGDMTLYDHLQQEPEFNDSCTELYTKVLQWLPEFQISAGKNLDFSYCYQHPEFGYDAMLFDFNYFLTRFVNVFYQGGYNNEKLFQEFQQLVKVLLEPERDFFLYRDFQSRNIMIIDNNPCFIDYQSGRKGALHYDLASLLYDAKAKIPEHKREFLIKTYLNQLEKYLPIDVNSFLKYFYAYVWIRIMQALGAYGFLSQVKGKTGFLANVPLALNNIAELLQKHTIIEQLPEFNALFENLINDEFLYRLEHK